MRGYNRSQIEKMTNREINKAYSELRSIANKRIDRLISAGLGKRKVKFPTIESIRNADMWTTGEYLREVSNFLRSERTTVRGEKKFLSRFTETMNEMGYGDLVDSAENVYDLIDFMDDLREEYGNKLFDSGDALDVLQEAQRLNIPIEIVKEKFDIFTAHISDLEKVRPSKGGAEFSQRRINNLIKKWS